MSGISAGQLTAHGAAFLAAAAARSQQPRTSPKDENQTAGYFELYRDWPQRRRQAAALARALTLEPVLLRDGEYLYGHMNFRVPGAGSSDFRDNPRWHGHDAATAYARRVDAEIPELKGLLQNHGVEVGWVFNSCNSPGHVGWHWDWILSEGISGLMDRIERAEPGADATGRENLACMKMALQAVLDWNERHLEAMRQRLAASDGAEKASWEEKIAIGERVPRYGARNFREAVQAFHFSYLCTMFESPYGGNGPGRLDYYLHPYLARDLGAGATDMTRVREIMEELFIRFHERWGFGSDGAVETIVVGGCDADGAPFRSPLTELMVDVIGAVRIPHPSVYIRIPEQDPDSLLALAVRDLIHGGNRAQILNDREIIAAITRDGHISVRDARMYMCGGCMEISPQGMNGDLLFAGFYNSLKVLEYVLTGGYCLITGERRLPHLERTLADFTTFDELYQAFVAELRRTLKLGFHATDLAARTYAEFRPRFLLSSQIDDCIARGRCIHEGGARYEDFGSTPLGLPNVADALTAIRHAVFESRWVSGADLLEALRRNFDGTENLRRYLLQLPKYGQGDAGADTMADRVVADTCAVYETHTNCLGGRVKPMIMTFMMAPVAGAGAGASADGRRQGAPIAQGMTPQSAAMDRGLLTAIRSAAALPLRRFSGGAANIWDLDPALARADILAPVLKTFFELGGQMFQGNVTAVEELLAAQKEPELYSRLMVRVGGYSGCFTTLEKRIQDEIISRRRHQA